MIAVCPVEAATIHDEHRGQQRVSHKRCVFGLELVDPGRPPHVLCGECTHKAVGKIKLLCALVGVSDDVVLVIDLTVQNTNAHQHLSIPAHSWAQ